MAVIFQDSFVDTAGTNLASHVPDTTGDSWVLISDDTLSGDMEVNPSGTIQHNTSENSEGEAYAALISETSGVDSSEYDTYCTIEGFATSDDTFGLFARLTVEETAETLYGYTTWFDQGNDYTIREIVGNSGTNVATNTAGATYGDGDELQFSITDALKDVLLDEGAGHNSQVTWEEDNAPLQDTALYSAGLFIGTGGAGSFFTGDGGDDTNGAWEIVDFRIETPDAGGAFLGHGVLLGRSRNKPIYVM